ncbi:hypothetical protein WG68_06530 [Arsukibacterium ikkense]|uniref:Teneurin-like YD-shell domain-containing protein n=1 Tax=Arsukibacterium ikkense TaxID=336831 RepID=A0A0M2V9T4_9GAMM|nr:RHS repeat-associated core domain-containing protein [Arsukibacterium ikkense]KKO46415.1 hypothetical protein WG68_06530 [Arsukibacterium ikkense]
MENKLTFSLLAVFGLSGFAHAYSEKEIAELSALFIQAKDPLTSMPPPMTAQSMSSSGDDGAALKLMTELALSRMEVKEQITPETTDLFGDRVDLNSGSISFSHIDVALKGNSNLPVEIRRAYRGSKNNRGNNSSLGDWVLEIPSISTTTLEYKPGFLSHIPNCGYLSPAYADTGFATVGPAQYWSGDILDVPGVTNQKLREAYTTGGAIAGRVADNWKVTCLNDRYGFEAISPEGTKYTFDVVRLVPASLVLVAQEADVLDPNYDVAELLRSYTLNVQVSRIEDRFGNWVNYVYDAATLPYGSSSTFLSYSNKLVKIESSDTRVVDIFYESGTNTDRIERIEADGKTWRYRYISEYDAPDQLYKDVLTEVERPDNKKWLFDLVFDKFGGITTGAQGLSDCQVVANVAKVSTITHPEGAVFKLTQKPAQFGRTEVPYNTSQNPSETIGHHTVSRCVTNLAISKKELLFNQQNLTWNYSYSQNAGSPRQMGNTPLPAALTGLPAAPSGYSLMDLRSTTVSNPDGSKTVHVFDRKFHEKEGQEVQSLYYDTDGNTLLKAQNVSFTVLPKTGKVRMVSCKPSQYPIFELPGDECNKAFENEAKEENHVYQNVVKTSLYSEGVATDFTTEYSNYNSYGKPELVKETSSFGTKYTKQSYLQDTDLWVLNLPTVTQVSANNSSYTTVAETSYYSATHDYKLLPYQSKRFGQLVSTNSSYHADGNLKRQTYNVPNRYIEYNNYVRGIPQQITLPGRYNASATKTANLVVNTKGEITSVTNFNGHTFGYEYDIMGRVELITPPSGWTPTTITYTSAADRFVQTLTKGSYQKRIEMDALFRPLLTREYDTANNIITYVNQQFDAYNQPVFTSYPSTSSTETDGTAFVYDGLQRLLQQTSTVDNLGSNYYYLSGNRVQMVNAKGHSTITTYKALGAPAQKLPTLIEQPEGVTTSLDYNLFDNLVTVQQGAITELRRYNAQQRLCRLVRPDVGHTAYDYNVIGEVFWEAKGASGKADNCNTASVLAAEKVSFSYDNIGNVHHITYPDTSGNIVHTFDAQGQLTKLTSGAHLWDYSYNSLGLLDTETLTIDNLSFMLDPEYNAMGHLASLTYPSARTVSFAPNAFGQATTAGTYATAAQYYPTGQLKQFSYGNGLTFNQTLDDKMRPYTRTVSKSGNLLAQTYTYDDNDNIDTIIDSIVPGNSLTLGYDNLDRLTSASGFWGSGSFSYDARGNIESKNLGSEQLTYNYGTNNRLNSVTGSLSRTFGYDSRGNITSNGQRSFVFNRANRLASSGSISYSYDGHGRRVLKNNNGAKTYSLYNSQGVLMSTYESGGYTDYFYLGSQLVAKYNDPNTQSDKPGYTGHVEDEDLQLTYMQQRYYDPVIGRFYSNDPVGFTPSNPMMFNRYAYANNNPYKFVDPDGRNPTGRGMPDLEQARAQAPFVIDAIPIASDIKGIADAVQDPSAVNVIAAGVGLVPLAGDALAAIAKNIKRFIQKAPANAKTSIEQKSLPNDGVAVQATSPGNVPGSKAVYEKQIDSNGNTVQYTKTTYDPDGEIVHVKDKISNEEFKRNE